ncbi:unnamed protein product [Amoebophrya sp. A120]|nr:unnamed protein product [Amoebophrya sp. A120]|eukprot:GSA120T00011777001.1
MCPAWRKIRVLAAASRISVAAGISITAAPGQRGRGTQPLKTGVTMVSVKKESAGECTCVNQGADKFTAPSSGAANEMWLRADGKGTAYGETYAVDFGGPKNYGEYCFAWDDDCDGGKSGTKAECAIAADKCADAKTFEDPRNTTCYHPWCFIRAASAANGAIAQTGNATTDQPQCSNYSLQRVSLVWVFHFLSWTCRTAALEFRHMLDMRPPFVSNPPCFVSIFATPRICFSLKSSPASTEPK